MKIISYEMKNFMGQRQQCNIPIFQREYVWDLMQCEKLIKDIYNVGKDNDKECHFIGSIIWEETANDSGIKRIDLIDGQQRYTTISLFIKAVLENSKNRNDYTDIEAELSDLLINKTSQKNLSKKLYFHLDDENDTYSKILDNDSNYSKSKNTLARNYKYIYEIIEDNKHEIDTYLEGLRKLKIVNIEVEPKLKDNALSVFETVNGTGINLNNKELIKNFILMTASDTYERNQLYTDKWRVMETNLGNKFDNFVEYLLTIVLNKKMTNKNDTKTYYEFKTYLENNFNGISTSFVRNEMFEYYTIYKRILEAKDLTSNKIETGLYRINTLGQGIFIPVVMKLIYNNNTKQRDVEVVKILGIIESYIVRTLISGGQSRDFGDIHIKMLKALSNDVDYSNFTKLFDTLADKQKMKDNRDILDRFVRFNIYTSKNNLCRYVLDRLEKALNKDYTKDQSWTIEHIMPQTILTADELNAKYSDPNQRKKYDWISLLGNNWEEIHNKYVHTIGNLTLSGFNGDYQNMIFTEKRDLTSADGQLKGYKDTPIRISQSLKKLNKWEETEILDRANELANLALKVWPYYK